VAHTHDTDMAAGRPPATRRPFAMFWLPPRGPSARRNPPGAADLPARRLLDLLET